MKLQWLIWIRWWWWWDSENWGLYFQRVQHLIAHQPVVARMGCLWICGTVFMLCCLKSCCWKGVSLLKMLGIYLVLFKWASESCDWAEGWRESDKRPPLGLAIKASNETGTFDVTDSETDGSARIALYDHSVTSGQPFCGSAIIGPQQPSVKVDVAALQPHRTWYQNDVFHKLINIYFILTKTNHQALTWHDHRSERLW